MFPVETIIQNVIDKILWPIFAGVMIIMTFWAGYQFLSANGDPSKLSNARKTFLLVVIGVAIGVGAQGIILIIKNILG